MLPFLLFPQGAKVLEIYCKKRKDLFDVIPEKHKVGYVVRKKNDNIINKKFKMGVLFNVEKEPDNDKCYFYPNTNLIYELEIEELTELIIFLDQIRDRTKEKIDLRLFKD